MPNLFDQDDVLDFDNKELEDLQKITDEDFFDLADEFEKREKIAELIKKIIEEKQKGNNWYNNILRE